jgi:hypothetical protein
MRQSAFVIMVHEASLSGFPFLSMPWHGSKMNAVKAPRVFRGAAFGHEITEEEKLIGKGTRGKPEDCLAPGPSEQTSICRHQVQAFSQLSSFQVPSWSLTMGWRSRFSPLFKASNRPR